MSQVDKTMPCFDCRISTVNEYYMVHASLWPLPKANVVTEVGYFLCVGCLERRLGRLLTPADFTDAPVNRLDCPLPKSDSLLNRLGLAK